MVSITLPNFAEGNYFLVGRSDFNAGEKIVLHWCSPCCVMKALNDYVFQVEDLGNGKLDNVHGTLL